VFAVFFFALLRFMYGAWKFHEHLREDRSPLVKLWNVGMMIIVFLTFYASGLAIKSHALMFYKLFAIAHSLDFVWFSRRASRTIKKWLNRVSPITTVETAACHFVILDVITILWSFLCFSQWNPWSPFKWSVSDWGGYSGINVQIVSWGMIIIGMLDLRMNRSLYFDGNKRAPFASPDLSSTKKGAVYLAAPLFTEAEWQWNAALAKRLRDAGYSVTVPQECAAPMLLGTKPFDAAAIFRSNVRAIEQSVCVVAVLDGPDCDSGTCWECGYAKRAKVPIIGLRTDIRGDGGDQAERVNLMLTQSCDKLIIIPRGNRDDREAVVKSVLEALGSLIKPLGQAIA